MMSEPESRESCVARSGVRIGWSVAIYEGE